MADQIDMFGSELTPTQRVLSADHDEELHELAGQVSAHFDQGLRLGTSSWAFSGWDGLVYRPGPGQRSLSQELLSREGLGAYSGHPMFRTVGIDRSFYRPMTHAQLAEHAAQVPDDFRFLKKAHADCTTAIFPQQARYGQLAGQFNPRFFDLNYALEHVVDPFIGGLGPKAGVLLFQSPPQPLTQLDGPRGFIDRLDQFLRGLPRGPNYAFEVRNRDLLTPEYFATLRKYGAQHCLNALPGMPTIAEQAGLCRKYQLPIATIRWMLALHHDYDSAKASYAPFDALVDEDASTRHEIIDALIEQAIRAPTPAYVIVNNKAEGSSPQSIEALVRALVRRLNRNKPGVRST